MDKIMTRSSEAALEADGGPHLDKGLLLSPMCVSLLFEGSGACGTWMAFQMSVRQQMWCMSMCYVLCVCCGLGCDGSARGEFGRDPVLWLDAA